MVQWKDKLKKVAVATGKGIAKGTKAVVKEAVKQEKKFARKRAILNRMTKKQVLQIAKKYRISPITIEDEKPGIENYYIPIMAKFSLDELVSIAKKYGINVNDIIQKIDDDKTKQEIQTFEKQGRNIITEIAQAITEFKPSRHYHKEFPFQIELKGFLTRQFPTAKIEDTKGSSRPDIVISGVAIEVKGPTYDKDLITIADKCIRYKQYFKTGIIAVLFDVNVNERRYQEWYNGIKETHPDVIIIRK